MNYKIVSGATFSLAIMLSSHFAMAESAVPLPKIIINYKSQDGCSFMYSPVNFCDETHMKKYSASIREGRRNFFKDYIVVTHLEWPEYHQRSIVVINKETGEVYPVPIVAYSGTPGVGSADGELKFSLNSRRLCIKGDILVYKSIKTGRFCFDFVGDRFAGYHTEYMN